jgi:Mg-chelatase subunit ChlD
VVEKIQIEGSTFLSGGLFLGVDQLMTSQEPNNIRTVLLFTDGEPTDGICEEDALVRELKQRVRECLTFFLSSPFLC